MQFMFILMLIFAILVAIFALQNAYPVTIYFLKWQFEASFGLVILICILIGAVSLGSLGLLHRTKDRLKARNQGKMDGETVAEEGEWTEEPSAEPQTTAPGENLIAETTGETDTKINAAGGGEDPFQEMEN